MSTVRTRLSPDETRAAALEAARELLIDGGPGAVTLKAVAARVGKTHGTLLHHFGSAAELQSALATAMVERVTEQVAALAPAVREGSVDARAIVDLTFDIFDREGAGALASSLILAGNVEALAPITLAIHRLVDRIAPGGHEDRRIHGTTLALILSALGDSLIGEPLAREFGLPREAARGIAREWLVGRIGGRGEAGGQTGP